MDCGMNLGVDFMVKKLYDLTLIHLRGTGEWGIDTPDNAMLLYIVK